MPSIPSRRRAAPPAPGAAPASDVDHDSMPAEAVSEPAAASQGHLLIQLTGLRSSLLNAGRLLAEALVVPTALLAVLLNVVGLRAALAAVVGWCLLMIAFRWLSTRRVPGTLVVCSTMLAGKAAASLASSTVIVYVIQPVIGSAMMALIFLVSALAGRPITIRLARDFVHVPAQVLRRRGVRRMFTHVAVLWGVSRLIDAGMSIGFLQLGVQAGLIGRSVASPALTVLTIGVCAIWAWRALHRDGVKVCFAPRAAL